MPDPTPRQREILAHVAQHTHAFGCPPTVRELAGLLGLSSYRGVHNHLQRLQTKGLVSWEPRLARTLRLTDAGSLALKRVAHG